MTFISRRVGIVASLVSLQESMMRRFLLTILLMLVVSPAWAVTNYYVDPDYAGTRTGSASQPWQSLADSGAWTTINSTLASDDITIYYSARNAGSDTNQKSTTAIDIYRTDTSTHVLTLDGISQYNTNDASPSWAPYITPSPTNYKAASKFQITATTPIQGAAIASNTNCVNYVMIQGFRLIYTGFGGQVANLAYIGNLIFQYNEGSASTGVFGGPGFIVGPAHGPTCAVDHVTVRYNYIHNTYGECIYVGGASPTGDPPGTPGATPSGDDYLIQGNTIESCAQYGGQGDGIDVKEGHTNLRLIGNTIRPALGGYGYDGQCIALDSGQLVDGNYCEAPVNNALAVSAAWDNTVGRDSLVIRNNVFVNLPVDGIRLYGASGDYGHGPDATYQWSNTKVYNNSIYLVAGDCISIFGPQVNVAIENNILHSCGFNGIKSDTVGLLATHDYNNFYNITRNALANAGTNTTCANITTIETHSVCANPTFVSTSAPYSAKNFMLRAGSPAIGTGLNLSGTFTNAYAGLRRADPWDRGAFKALNSLPPRPNGLNVR